MLEIRIHGRGGQGAVTTSYLLAVAAFNDNYESQAFPMFGVERSGAPVQSFCRIDKKKINLRQQVYNPDIVIVLDSSLMKTIDVTSGLKKDGLLLINTEKSDEELKLKGNYKIHSINVDEIAQKIFGKPIVNTAMLGAFSAVTNIVSLKALKKACEFVFKAKGENIIKLNKKAIEQVYNNTKNNKKL